MNDFRKRIRKSLANPILQTALDANAQRRVEGSVTAFASLPDHQERRQRVHEIREGVIANLDEVVAQFLSKVEENGIIIHQAKDAGQAVEIALNIINSVGANGSSPLQKLVAKSKSMVTEEIGLNHALEAARHRVVETDLGEYIVQLRHEKPSHIITPAVHLRKQEVAKLFHEELGIPYTEDIPTLTKVARKTLREVFLSADIGVSGVNFGVAESGTLCIVTNEGNGRMVTTLPKTHIAVMGMERLVPTMHDLALMLSLLPRSATTQKISVYTQFIQRPLPDQQRHLILLDNRRSLLRNSPINESLLCIRCGACLNACPIFREIGGHAYDSVYPGPIGSVISAGLFGAEHAELAQACTVCGACKQACPVDIDLPKLLLRVRAGEFPNAKEDGAGLPNSVKLGLKAFRRIALHPRLFSAAQIWMGRIASITRGDYFHLPVWTGWGYSKDFPRPVAKPFRAGFSRQNAKSVKIIREDNKEIATSGIPQTDSLSLIDIFTHEVIALSGRVIRVKQRELNARLKAELTQREVIRAHVEAGLAEEHPNLDIALETEANPNIPVGITRAVAAVAETGSILITGEDRDQLSASLLPEIHIAILQASDIHKTLEEMLTMPVLVEAPAASLISGPSRTADIEMTLTIGVHGPRELIIFLVDG